MCKLLILDDDPIQHLIFKRMLRKYENYTDTLFSFNGNDVLDFLENHKMNMSELPELIFLDINMPNLNGWLFLEKLKKIYPKLNKLIDVYIISSSIDPQEIRRTNNYKFVKSYIIKPLTSEKLNSILTL